VNASEADAAARDRIATDLDSTLFVEAGAGTGKTTALVGRIVELVASGRAVLSGIAAITFTEAAASELRDRLREALETLAATGDIPRSTRAADAVAELDAAAISTLHGFAQRILADHPFEAGLPPTFEVFDEIRSAVAFDERWRTFVDELLADEELQPVVRRALVTGVRLDQLRRIAAELNRNWDLLVDHPPTALVPPPIDPSMVLAALDEAVSHRLECRDDDDKLAVHLDALVEVGQRVRTADGELELLDLLVRHERWTCRNGRKENWDGAESPVRDALERAQRARDELVSRVQRAALGRLLVALAGLTLDGAEARRAEGGLEFHDLLVQARALLRDHPPVTAQLHETYTHLLIDEFQDTDPIQLELAVRIATGRAGEGDWNEWPVPAGRLFFVGDPKQSIYRFRRADVEVFLDARHRYGDEPVQLTRNHRSVPDIVDWVNQSFAPLIGDGATSSQPAYLALDPHRRRHVGVDAPAVVVLGDEAEGVLVADVRAAEADELVDMIARVGDEKWPVGDDGRPAERRDICILVPSRTTLPALERALDRRGVPYRVESSSLVYGSSEVRELLNVLRAIDDPTDELALVASLRSPWFGCGDDDLVEFRAAGGRWDLRHPGADELGADHPVLEGIASLRRLHDQRWWRDASGLISQVLVERRAFELGLDERRPRDAWRRLRFVVDQARAFTDAYGTDLRRYLAWAELQSADDARVVESVLPESDDDAVRIMTIHAAKGLEFPVVALAGLGTEDRRAIGVDVLWGDDGPQVKLKKGSVSDGYQEAADREDQRQAEEQLRLLYVASTRARDHLIVSLHHKARLRCHAARLHATAEATAAPAVQLEPRGPRPAATAPAPSRPTPHEVDDERRARADWMDARTLRLASTEPRAVAATGIRRLVELAAPQTALDADDGADEPVVPSRRGRAGTAVGRAVHAVLQTVDLATGDGLAAVARAQASAEGVVERADEIERLSRLALAAPIVRRAAATRHWRELYVGVPVGSRVLEGFVDLLLDGDEGGGDDGLTVVDYKTDSVASDADLDRVAASYRWQAAAYAVALEAALDRPVRRCVLLFLRGGQAVERDVDDLGAAKADVRRALGAT
jgi:ATP-dependent exoDNAse (exonuclease V) beta subunit